MLEEARRQVHAPSPSGRGRRDSLIEAGAPGEGRAKREPDRAKPQKKSNRILRPSPCPLPEGEGTWIPLRKPGYTVPYHLARGMTLRRCETSPDATPAEWTANCKTNAQEDLNSD